MASKRDPRKKGLPRRPVGPLTGPRFQFARALAGEYLAAFRRGAGICCLCGERRAVALYQKTLTPDQARRAGLMERKYTVVQQGVCPACDAAPDRDARLDAGLERSLDAPRDFPAFDLGDLDPGNLTEVAP
ncbi:MAG: hypothetical protein JO284_04495 [Planctomycetaceae bacterium]|nr:hypothetical protein [Planctomycetaceae bacterium]MBV8609627.1 hypothetical protein [Singulisphaera sp.]MBV8228883.1 hypothetical protein [Planctomycetaceae bacterium]MBV8315955.1 hypothetical protein [Planctomycetaceae bacterium]MBV8383082.1 hypothetical protein [Planctomycetaceae bacterium]